MFAVGTSATTASNRPGDQYRLRELQYSHRYRTETATDSTPTSGNVIAGNLNSRFLNVDGPGSNVTIAGNYLEPTKTGMNLVGTSTQDWGLRVAAGPSGVRVGTNGDGVADDLERNVIAGNFRQQSVLIQSVTNVSSQATTWGSIAMGPRPWAPAPRASRVSAASGIRIGTDGNGNGFDGNERNRHRRQLHFTEHRHRQRCAERQPSPEITWGSMRVAQSAVGSSVYGIRAFNASNIRVGTNGDGVGDDAERNVVAGIGRSTALPSLVQARQRRPCRCSTLWVAGNYIGVDATGIECRRKRGGISTNCAKRVRCSCRHERRWGRGRGRAKRRRGKFSNSLVFVQYTDTSSIAGNYFGTDKAGMRAVGNSFGGVFEYGVFGHSTWHERGRPGG